ncbi:MAG TPA: methyltransferase domain-containing protein [Thermoanaerobaculia bacterium]|nr:methyltransferase domain-containing protein [Thermoanaerobaculia bacterium]
MNLRAAETVLEREVRRLYEVPPEAPIESLDEPARTYVRYALETVKRGRLALEELRPYKRLKGIRFLDAGCAYAGFLAAAAEAGASEVVGVDMDDRFLDIARPFIGATGIPHRLEKGDVSDAAFLSSFGAFDLITCNDVIEHVDSVPRCLESLAGALAADGYLYLAAPNRLCPEFIRKDPHFQFFGIVLLPRPDARRFYVEKTKWPHYDVGDYYEIPDFRPLLDRLGLEFQVINAPDEAASRALIGRLEADFDEIERRGMAFDEPAVPAELVEQVRQAVAETAATFHHRVERFRALEAAKDPAAGPAALELGRDYAVPVWHILVHKPGTKPEGGGLWGRLKGALRG